MFLMLLPVFVLIAGPQSARTDSRKREVALPGGVTTGEQLVCSDGATLLMLLPGLCADGSQPQWQRQAPENVSGAPWWCNH